jgi:hypothetical protein
MNVPSPRLVALGLRLPGRQRGGIGIIQPSIVCSPERVGQFIMMCAPIAFVDLSENRSLVTNRPLPRPICCSPNFLGEGQLGPRKETDCHSIIFGCTKKRGARNEHAGGWLIADLRRPRSDGMKAEIAHLGTPDLALTNFILAFQKG